MHIQVTQWLWRDDVSCSDVPYKVVTHARLGRRVSTIHIEQSSLIHYTVNRSATSSVIENEASNMRSM